MGKSYGLIITTRDYFSFKIPRYYDKGGNQLDYVYFIENTTDNYVDNTELFSLIRDLDIDENEIFIDTGISKKELEKLLDLLEEDDRLIIRSVIDLSFEAAGLLKVLEQLQEKKIILCSINEPTLNGLEYYSAMKCFVGINIYYLERKRKEKYQEAKLAGIVGRPKMTEQIEKAIRLYKTKAFTTAEIEKLSGVSSSSLYRALREQERSS